METPTQLAVEDADKPAHTPGKKALFAADGEPVSPKIKDEAGGETTEAGLKGATIVYDAGDIKTEKIPQDGVGAEAARHRTGTRAIYQGRGRFVTNIGGVADMGTTASFWMSQSRSARATLGTHRGIVVMRGGLQKDAVPARRQAR